ncbi:hypothetical protein BDN72DRAFT_966029 [Pluteus cervinus]|uniref:Uncharacterized protein n=1 Tax=Pluteus cervinus TaxID=181527 RepID=A0ACD3A1Q3_9AGAR|nr:hypothetical protein BDN72DRAFT_966029 [Pluteus cervinus]
MSKVTPTGLNAIEIAALQGVAVPKPVHPPAGQAKVPKGHFFPEYIGLLVEYPDPEWPPHAYLVFKKEEFDFIPVVTGSPYQEEDPPKRLIKHKELELYLAPGRVVPGIFPPPPVYIEASRESYVWDIVQSDDGLDGFYIATPGGSTAPLAISLEKRIPLLEDDKVIPPITFPPNQFPGQLRGGSTLQTRQDWERISG